MIHKAKLTSKGQITIPAPVREALAIQPGDKIAFLPGANGEFRVCRVRSISDLAGSLSGYSAPKTNAELDELMAAHAAELDAATMSGAQPDSDSEAA